MFDVVLLMVFLKPVFLFMALFVWHDDMVIQHKNVYLVFGPMVGFQVAWSGFEYLQHPLKQVWVCI